MKARTQTVFIAVNVVIAPLVVFLVALALQGIKERKTEEYINSVALEARAALKRGEMPTSPEIENLQRIQNFRMIVLTSSQKVFYSSVPGIAVGDTISEVLSFLHREKNYEYEFKIVTDLRNNGPDFRDFTAIIRSDKRRGGYRFANSPSDYLILSMIAIMLISISIAILILHKITSSITRLDKATRDLSLADFDKPIDIRGSDEIVSLVHSFNLMRIAIRRSVVKRNNFVMGISHDFKTPLALIRGYAEILEGSMPGLTKKQKEYISSVGIKVEQIESMIDDLMEFITIDANGQIGPREKVKFAGWMINYAERCASDAALLGKRIDSDVSISPGTSVRMDERLVERAFDNLVHNAFRYTDDGGIVRIEASETEGNIVIRFIDNGPGIDEKEIPFIFDMFYRGTPARRTEGMGLGLSVVKNIVDIHEWRIGVSSKPSTGTTFEIVIPNTAQ